MSSLHITNLLHVGITYCLNIFTYLVTDMAVSTLVGGVFCVLIFSSLPYKPWQRVSRILHILLYYCFCTCNLMKTVFTALKMYSQIHKSHIYVNWKQYIIQETYYETKSWIRQLFIHDIRFGIHLRKVLKKYVCKRKFETFLFWQIYYV